MEIQPFSILAFLTIIGASLVRNHLKKSLSSQIQPNSTEKHFDPHPQKDSFLSANAYIRLIGNTPLIELKTLSKLLGRKIIVKLESSNPGGTGKDRAAKFMLQDLEKRGLFDRKALELVGGIDLVEGTSGSTGIALAALVRPLAPLVRLHIVMPDDQAPEKRRLLETYGVMVREVPSCSIANDQHYVNQAKKLAKEFKNGLFLNQFENLANFQAHFEETGPEIWRQLQQMEVEASQMDNNNQRNYHSQSQSRIQLQQQLEEKAIPISKEKDEVWKLFPSPSLDAFIMSAGTGGTIAGVSRYLKSVSPHTRVVLADPQGSSLHYAVKYGVCYTPQQSERRLKRHRYDSIVEGVGLDRKTLNFSQALIDESVQVPDSCLIKVAHLILRLEGLFIGSSSALNLAATILYSQRLSPGSTLLTVICDSGYRHLSRFWNKSYVQSPEAKLRYGLSWPRGEADVDQVGHERADVDANKDEREIPGKRNPPESINSENNGEDEFAYIDYLFNLSLNK